MKLKKDQEYSIISKFFSFTVNLQLKKAIKDRKHP